MANFDDLEFNKKPYGEGIQALIFFDNGYGASIIQGGTAYTYNDEEYELAVIKGNKVNWGLCYNPPITYVIGHLTKNDITRYLNEIERLEEADLRMFPTATANVLNIN